ncbi:MAG: helix-turn-helix domain-containing protein, partial [Lentisphaeria bacterium]|nr:helix-turn-helix domain-containing protein [Lentisphaeria bacterium]
FMRVMGHNIGEYQIQCRMEEAVNMLMRGVSVKETAFNLGYKDQFFFSKQFHQKLGYPPSAINPLNPRGVRRYQPKDAPAEPSEPVATVAPAGTKAAAPAGTKATASASPKTKKAASAPKKSSGRSGR